MNHPPYGTLKFLILLAFFVANLNSLTYAAVESSVNTDQNQGTGGHSHKIEVFRQEILKNEKLIIKLREKVDQLDAQLRDLTLEIQDLQRLQEDTAGKLPILKHSIANILRVQYHLKRDTPLKLLLSNSNPATTKRHIRYHEYLAAAQNAQLANFSDALKEQTSASTQLLKRRNTVNEVRLELSQELSALQKEQASRREKVIALIQQFKASAKIPKAIRDDKKSLNGLAKEVGNTMRIDKRITQNKGRLPPPLRGKLVTGFQQKDRYSGIPSTGIVLQAPLGTDIRSIFPGQVVYSDWFRGFGLLLVLDHGDNMLSLYGYNSELLFPVGSTVNSNTVIARVGNTGGRAQSELYFEIRKSGKPQDPLSWIQE